ncbi:acyltransferase family protein [Edaphobacter bradus]|uniref:acyltransferase family protein n=1 Tax=Edaphobacter bradus TaxID=2259016 RepID=UPI0021DF4418|nr:acyltransferase [Edaphobacter bradus]
MALTKRIPTLDGWRGVAILMVIVTHLQSGLLGHVWRYKWMDLGQHGVSMFFVLSGFLITSRLLAEEKIGLRRFYLRRVFRLMPCAWAYLAFVALFGLAFKLHIIGEDVWACLFFFRNYLPEQSANAMTSHFWSLSIEEQFYLVWPFLLFLAGKRKAFWIGLSVALACAAYRFHHWDHLSGGIYNLHTEVRIDALMAGCLFAILNSHEPFRRQLQQNVGIPLASSLLATCLCIYNYQTFVPLTESAFIGLAITCTSLAPSSLAGRVLEYKHLKFLGVLSYSLYVWQEFFLVPHWGPIGIAILPLIAIASFSLIERPGIALGRWLEARLRSAHETTETNLKSDPQEVEPA